MNNINDINSPSIENFHSVFGFNDKFFENLIYLSGIVEKGDDEGDTAGSHAANICDICAIVFLKLPCYLLSCDKQRAGQLLVDKIKFDKDTYNDNVISSNALEWIDICKLFHTSMLKSTASLLVGIGPRTLISGDYLTSLIKAITLLRPNTNSIINDDSNKDDMTFSQYIQSVNTRIRRGKDIQIDNNSSDNVIDEEEYMVQRVAQDIWIHFVFLTRDLLIQFPELLPKTLPQLCASLINEDEASSVFLSADRNTFPTSSECLLVLVFSSIAVSLSVSRQSTTSAPELEDVKVTMIKKQVRTKRVAAARVCLKTQIDPIFDKLTDIIERMLHHSPDKGVEAAAMLCDIVQLFITIDDSVTMNPIALKELINNSHEKMITSRVLSILVKIWMDLLPASNNDHGTNMIATASRITRLLSAICLQRVQTGTFVLRLPNFIKSVVAIKDTWNDNNSSVIIVKSGCLISLLLGLAVALDSTNTNNDTRLQIELTLQSTMKHIIDEFTRINIILSSRDLNDSNTGRLIRSDNALPLIDSLTVCIEAHNIRLLNKAHKDMIRQWTIDIVNITNTITSRIIAKKSNQTDINNTDTTNVIDKSLDSLDDNLSYYDDIKRLCKGFRSLLEEQQSTKID